MVRVYLDNCCYNRPYDDQTQFRIYLEAQAKIFIQDMIRNNEVELVSSYMMIYESSFNPSETKRISIRKFMEDYSDFFVDGSYKETAELLANDIRKTGVKSADSLHIACAIIANCDYFITTDDRLLKYKSNDIKIVTPISFLEMEGG